MIEKRLTQTKKDFEVKIKELQQEVESLRYKGEGFMIEAVFKEVKILDSTLEDYLEEQQEINVKESLIGFAKSEFTILVEIKETLSVFYNCWNLCNQWMQLYPEWKENQQITSLDYSQIESKIKQMFNQSQTIMFNLQKMTPTPVKAMETLGIVVKEISEFKNYMPLI